MKRRVIDLLFHDHGTRRGEGSASRSGRSLPRERPGTICTGGWVGPRARLDRCEKSRPTGNRSPDRPARSQSLYRLHYPVHIIHLQTSVIDLKKFFIKIHNHRHVSAVLLNPQTDYNYIKLRCPTLKITLKFKCQFLHHALVFALY